jgi:ribosomal-protein-alanine N-acetyltransferase
MIRAQNLESERLVYKRVSLAHLSEDYVGWLNDPEISRFIEKSGDYTLDKLRAFLTDVQEKDLLFWGIHLKSNGLHLGNIKIDPINERHGFGEYGILMGRKAEWGKGYAKEASQTIMDFCFKTIKLRKMTLGVVVDNTAAVNLYKSLGFDIEGFYKKHVFFDGKYCDVLRMARFNPEFSYEK